MPHFSLGINSYRKEFAPKEQILSCKSRSHFERAMSSRNASRKSQKLSLFVNEGELLHLNHFMSRFLFFFFFSFLWRKKVLCRFQGWSYVCSSHAIRTGTKHAMWNVTPDHTFLYFCRKSSRCMGRPLCFFHQFNNR